MTLEYPKSIRDRRIPALIAYLTPFRIVESTCNTSPWNPTIVDINSRTWDYVALHEISGGVDVGLTPPFHMAIAHDGALALPTVKETSSLQNAVRFYNQCLCRLLLGGVYCEAISTECIVQGSIIDQKYVRAHSSGRSAASRFHSHIRQMAAGPLESIALLNPPKIDIANIQSAMSIGTRALGSLEPMNGEYLLSGVTGIAKRDWGRSLINLWIVVEQLVEVLWKQAVIKPAKQSRSDRARTTSLQDNRSWSLSNKSELLYQIGKLDQGDLANLNLTRRSRNKLFHEGVHPTESDVDRCYKATCALIQRVSGDPTLPFLSMDPKMDAIRDIFSPPAQSPAQPEYWLPIPKLPGEEELEKLEAGLLK